jgi:hypothetical protein
VAEGSQCGEEEAGALMPKVKSTDRIQLIDGTVTTLAEALDAGIMVPADEPVLVDSPRAATGSRLMYWIGYASDPDRGVEVSKFLWQSRSGEVVG